MRRLAMTLAIVVALSAVWLPALQAADEGPTSATDPAARLAAPAVTTSATPTTRLYVKTVPPGAQVTLDGKLLGPSDGLFIVPPGVSSVKVEFTGQEPRVQQVEIAAGRITRLEIDFAEQPPVIGPAPGSARSDAPAGPASSLPDPLVLPRDASRDATPRVVHVLSLADGALAEVPMTAEMTLAFDIDGALVRPLPPELIFESVPLREVVRRLGEAAAIEISIDESGLRAAGIDPESPITAHPGGVPLGSALSAIVRTWQLRWLAKDDRVVITTSGADQGPTERGYFVADLIGASDPGASGLFRFLSEASWPVEQGSVTPYRPLTIGRLAFRDAPAKAKNAPVFLVRAEWWRQFRATRLVALLRQLRKTPVADRVPLSADGYWSDSTSAAAARAALDRPLESEVAIDGVPLGDAIAMLSKAAGVPIAIDTVAFAGSPRMQRPAVFRWPTKGQTLAAVLEGMLDNGLGYEVARDQLTVTSASVSAAAYYPVDDLLAAGHTFDSLRSRIGSQGGPTWVIDGGVNCLAITRNTAGHRRVEKIIRSLRDEERRRNANSGVDPTAVVSGLTAEEMVARCLERTAADAPVAGVFKMTEENCWPVGPDTRPDVRPVRDDPVLECRWAWDGTTTVGERLPTFSAPFGFLRTGSLSLKEVAEGQWQLRTERLGTPPHPGWFYCHPEGSAWSSLVLVDPKPRFDGVPAAGSRWIRLATSGVVGEVRLWIREADVRIQGYELFLSGKLFRRLDIERFAESDDGRAFPAKARLQTWNPFRHDEECCTRQLEAIEVEFPKGKAETARSLELILPRGSRVDEFEHGSNDSVATKFIREPTPASEVMARSQLRSATAERPPAPAGGATQHEAVTSLRVLQPDKDDYEVYRKTQAQLLKSPFVFQKALREPGIAELPTLAAEKDPVAWLSKHVKASAPRDSEIIEVRLRGTRADDIRQILDAITTVYLKEVVQKERRERIERRRTLDKTREKAMEELHVAREALARATDDSDRDRLRGDALKLEQATNRLQAELDAAEKGIASIPDRVELVEAASPQVINR
jgi:hypothetical protein